MSTAHPGSAAPVPTHLRVAGPLSLLWNCFGAFDYIMTETRNPSYMQAFTPEQLDYFYSFPNWAVATWALGVWGGVLGSGLLILRRAHAVPVFGVSLAGVVVTTIYNYGLSSGFAIMGGWGGVAFAATILGVALALFLYARRLARSGMLR